MVFVLEAVRQNSAISNKVQVQSTRTHWVNSDQKCVNEDKDDPTAAQRLCGGVFTSQAFMYEIGGISIGDIYLGQ